MYIPHWSGFRVGYSVLMKRSRYSFAWAPVLSVTCWAQPERTAAAAAGISILSILFIIYAFNPNVIDQCRFCRNRAVLLVSVAIFAGKEHIALVLRLNPVKPKPEALH